MEGTIIASVVAGIFLGFAPLLWGLFWCRWRRDAVRPVPDGPRVLYRPGAMTDWEDLDWVLHDLFSRIAHYVREADSVSLSTVRHWLHDRVIVEILPSDAIVTSPTVRTGFLKRGGPGQPWRHAQPSDWTGPGADPNVIRVDGSRRRVRWFPWWGRWTYVAIVAQRPTARYLANGVTTPTAGQSYVQHEIVQHVLAGLLDRGSNAGHGDPGLNTLEAGAYRAYDARRPR